MTDEGVTLKYIAPARYIRAAGILRKTKRRRAAGSTSRFFVLTRKALYHFRRTSQFDKVWSLPMSLFAGDNKSRDRPMDVIPLSVCGTLRGTTLLCNITRASPGNGENLFTIEVKDESVPLILEAASKEICSSWIREINKAIADVKASKEPGGKELASPSRKTIASVAYPLFPKSNSTKLSTILLREGASCADIVGMGLLEKERDGALRSGWCTRLFVLTRLAIFYFRRDDTKDGIPVEGKVDERMFGEQRDIIPVAKVVKCTSAIKHSEGHYSFRIRLRSGREIVLRSRSQKIATEWSTAINAVVEIVKNDESDESDDEDDGASSKLRRGRDSTMISEKLDPTIIEKSDTIRFPSPSATSEMMYTGSVLAAVNLTIVALSDGVVPATASTEWYLLVGLLNALVWHLVDQYYQGLHQLSLLEAMQRETSVAVAGDGGAAAVAAHGASKRSPRGSTRVPLEPLSFDPILKPDGTAHVGPIDSSLFKVRSENYVKSRVKIKSGDRMYDFLCMHCWKSGDHTFDDVVRKGRITLPPPDRDVKTRCEKLGIKYYLVIYLRAPMKGVSAFNSVPSSVLNAVWIYRVRDAYLDALDGKTTCTKSHLLTQRWFREAAHSVVTKNRLKCICVADNFEILNLGSMFAGYNGKPCMITKSSTIVTGEDFLEVDINMMVFRKLPQVMFQKCIPLAPKLVLRLGFTIQGENEGELPEQMMCCLYIRKVPLDTGIPHIGQGQDVRLVFREGAKSGEYDDDDGATKHPK